MVNIDASQLNPASSYDFIIIGGGTAGLVLANRLTEHPTTTVLVIEAGEHRPDDPKINTPGLMASLGDDPTYDWTFRSVPQRHVNNRIIGHPRGRVLGGSSALQYGMFAFPSKAGIDGWAKLGNPSWTWDAMAPYYKKFHTLSSPSDETINDLSLAWLDSPNKGTNGPIRVSFAGSDFYGPLHMAWPRTFRALNCAATADPAGGVMRGAYCNPTTVDARDKSRSYAASAYYSPEVAKRSNLHVLTRARVEKITLDDMGYVATGVQAATAQGRTLSIKASKEVLLCCGAIQSPQLLELSGIGDSARLRAVGIEPLIHNPNVGENMQDHALAGVSFEVVEGTATAEALKQPGVLDKIIEQYNRDRSGFLTSSAICNAYMPLPEYLRKSGNAEERAELKRLIDEHMRGELARGHEGQYEVLRRIVEDEQESTAQYLLCDTQLNPHIGPGPSDWLGMKEDGDYLTIPAGLSHPFSRGSVHIATASINDPPSIDPKYLSNPLDLEILARHVMFSETIANTEPMAGFVKRGGRRIPSGADLSTVERAKDLVRRSLVSTYHPTSTCSMLRRENGGVVSEKLIVYGAKNLRVVDASIFPLIPRGNIQTTVYALAERGANLIRSYHNLLRRAPD